MRVLEYSPKLRAISIASEYANLLTIESHETSNLKPSYYEFDQMSNRTGKTQTRTTD